MRVRLALTFDLLADLLAAMSGVELFPSGVPSGPDVADFPPVYGEKCPVPAMDGAGRLMTARLFKR